VIAKITRGASFRGATRYAVDERHGLDREHQPEIIGGNMAGRTSTELAREFEAVRQQRPDIRKPVEHVSLSLARHDRPLSNEEMAQLADQYLTRRGIDTSRVQYVVVRHRDKGHQHCHMLLNRIRTDRTVVPQQFREYLRSKEACRALEREFRLQPVRDERRPFGERVPTRAEDRMARDRGLVSEKEQLKALIREAAKDRLTMSELVQRLQAAGVQVRANVALTGHVSGISYRLDRVAVKGSGLGRAYTFAGLQKELGFRYDRGRDLPVLERAARATQGLEPWRRRRRGGLRVPSPTRALDRFPGYQEARTALWLAHNMELASRSPGRALLNVAERLLPRDAKAGVRAIRTVIELTRGR
jgi:hypothetical protein